MNLFGERLTQDEQILLANPFGFVTVNDLMVHLKAFATEAFPWFHSDFHDCFQRAAFVGFHVVVGLFSPQS